MWAGLKNQNENMINSTNPIVISTRIVSFSLRQGSEIESNSISFLVVSSTTSDLTMCYFRFLISSSKKKFMNTSYQNVN